MCKIVNPGTEWIPDAGEWGNSLCPLWALFTITIRYGTQLPRYVELAAALNMLHIAGLLPSHQPLSTRDKGEEWQVDHLLLGRQ